MMSVSNEVLEFVFSFITSKYETLLDLSKTDLFVGLLWEKKYTKTCLYRLAWLLFVSGYNLDSKSILKELFFCIYQEYSFLNFHNKLINILLHKYEI